MRAQQPRGFTLIELMIVVAIIGILASIAIPTFMTFANKGKRTEAILALDKMTKNMRVYHQAKSVLPPSTNLMPSIAACANGGKTAQTVQSDWYANPGWATIEFHIDEPGYYQYQWTLTGADSGTATATADFDCDGVQAVQIISVSIATGNVFEALTTDITE